MILLAACTQTKRGKATPELLMRAHAGGSATAVLGSWTRSVEAAPAPSKAGELYKGAYWRSVQALRDHLGASILVASAGLGLVLEERKIPNYSATFRAGDPDSVPSADSAAGRRVWWNLLGGSGKLRFLDIAERPIVVVLPAAYLRILEPDLVALVEQHGPEKMIVFGPGSGPSPNSRSLAQVWVPLDARMGWRLGANVSALAPSVAKYCLSGSTADIDHDWCRSMASALVKHASGPVYPRRAPQTEQQVLDWIRCEILGPMPPTSPSVALRRFREAGRAFEQRRFHNAYRQVAASLEDEHE